jgi:hypothetical protein
VASVPSSRISSMLKIRLPGTSGGNAWALVKSVSLRGHSFAVPAADPLR